MTTVPKVRVRKKGHFENAGRKNLLIAVELVWQLVIVGKTLKFAAALSGRNNAPLKPCGPYLQVLPSTTTHTNKEQSHQECHS